MLLAEEARGVGDADRTVEAADRFLEARNLLGGHEVIGLVRARKMRQQANLEGRGFEVAQPLEGGRKLARAEAQAVHAGVDLDPEHERMRSGVALQDL